MNAVAPKCVLEIRDCFPGIIPQLQKMEIHTAV